MYRSFALRALVGISLLVAFYTFAIAFGLALIALPFAVMHATGRFSPLLFAVGMGGVAVVFALVPPLERFVEPGMPVTEDREPKLFALIRSVAEKMGQPMPERVYLVPEVNAFVGVRGGFWGFGGSRYMGVGVPLLSVTSVGELSAILAHEFGHYAGGDTRLLLLLRGARTAMIDIIQQSATMTRFVFSLVFRGFERVTGAISRQQEHVADEWSVRLAGRAATLRALQTVELHGESFQLFLDSEVAPMLQRGKAPENLFEGHRRFVRSTSWAARADAVRAKLAELPREPYDTHPPHAERLARVRAQPEGELAEDARPALELLGNASLVERFLSKKLAPDAQRFSWDALATEMAAASLARAERVQSRLPSLTAGRIAEIVTTPESVRSLAEAVEPVLAGYRGPNLDELRRRAAVGHLGAYLAHLLQPNGFRWVCGPGDPLMLEREGGRLDPTQLIDTVAKGEAPAEAVAQLLADHGVARDAMLPVPAVKRAQACRPRAALDVTREPKLVRVRLEAAKLVVPQCCAVCLGPPVVVAHTRFNVGGDEAKVRRPLKIPLHVCAAHGRAAEGAFVVRSFTDGFLTIEFSNVALADVFVRVHG